LLAAPGAGLDVSEAFAITELGKNHTEELVPAGKGFDLVVAPISFDALAELVAGQEIQELKKNGFAGVHVSSPSLR